MIAIAFLAEFDCQNKILCMYMFVGYEHVLIRDLLFNDVYNAVREIYSLRACQGRLRLDGHVRQSYGTA